MQKRTHTLVFILILWLAPALACNMPTVTPSSSPPGGVSSSSLRQTMRASTQASFPLSTPQPAAQDGDPPEEETVPTPTVNSPVVTPKYTQPPVIYNPGEFYKYYARPGDTLDSVAKRFGVDTQEISSQELLPKESYLPHGQKLVIPNVLEGVTSPGTLLPDSELVYSPSAADFDVERFVRQAGGFLSTYQGMAKAEMLSGAEIVRQVASELSVNPRLLLGILEYRAGWVYGQPVSSNRRVYPFGFEIEGRSGLYQEMSIAATQLNKAYYGWREGSFTELRYNDGRRGRLNPQLNAGSAALQHLFAMFHRQETWQEALYAEGSFLARYQEMFGDYWERAASVEPLVPDHLEQPLLELPFLPGERWSLTAGPHEAWNAGTPRGALDLSPTTGGDACEISSAWATASAPGIVVRSENNALALDLDGDGYEGSGWVLVYLHLAERGLVEAGTRVDQDDPLGHPSCEGGRATGKHVHVARKYNGEWLTADGPVPFMLSGWFAHADERNYHGTLERGDQIVSSDPAGGRTSTIIR